MNLLAICILMNLLALSYDSMIALRSFGNQASAFKLTEVFSTLQIPLADSVFDLHTFEE